MRNGMWWRRGVRSRLAALGCVLVIAALAGCGVTPGTEAGTSGAATNTASASATSGAATATTSATTTANASTGCPGPEQSVSWSTAPAAVVTMPQTTTSVKVGQTLEVRFPFGHRWVLAAAKMNGSFTLDTPAGYADTQTQSCTWHFTAKQAGSQDLPFTESPICQPHTLCPQNEIELDVTIQAAA